MIKREHVEDDQLAIRGGPEPQTDHGHFHRNRERLKTSGSEDDIANILRLVQKCSDIKLCSSLSLQEAQIIYDNYHVRYDTIAQLPKITKNHQKLSKIIKSY